MQHKPRNSSNWRWGAAVFVVAVLAVVVVKIFRPPPQQDLPEKESPADVSLVSTQILSFQLDSKAELDSVADESGSILMNERPGRPGAAIVHSDPSPAQMEIYKKQRELLPADDNSNLNKPGVPIHVE